MSNAAVTTTIFDLKHELPPVEKKFAAYNKIHSALKRISVDVFTYDIPYFDTLLMDAHTIRLYTDYNVNLCTRDGLPDFVPAYYNDFAHAMNQHDDSGYGWAIVDATSKTIIFDDKMTIADAASFYVRDSDLNSPRRRYLTGDEVMVTTSYYETAERLREQSLSRDNFHYNKRVNAKVAKSEPDVHSKDAKEAFARKRKALRDAAARKKPRVDVLVVPVASGSGAGSAGGEDAMEA
ncbi:hypothetical protein C8R44DRAFT_736965 [Mycena epipterygia]|nr:hypothetical protein C8R44DRAFT_736965 [Mycena epipterygia]